MLDEEENKKNVMGMSALGRCYELKRLVDCAAAPIGEVSKKLNAKWNEETVQRYISLAARLESMPLTKRMLELAEFHFARNSPFDNITAIRAVLRLGAEDADSSYVVAWLKFFVNFQQPLHHVMLFRGSNCPS